MDNTLFYTQYYSQYLFPCTHLFFSDYVTLKLNIVIKHLNIIYFKNEILLK